MVPTALNKEKESLLLSPDEFATACEATFLLGEKWLQELTSLPPAGRQGTREQTDSISFQQWPEDGLRDISRLLAPVVENRAPHCEQVGHPRYFAYVAGAGDPIAALGQWLSLILNPFTGTWSTAKSLLALEQDCINWLLELVGFSRGEGGGYLTSGSSLAILGALVAARDWIKKSRPEADLARLTLYASEETHHAFYKAVHILGFSEQLRILPVNSARQVNVDLTLKIIERDKLEGYVPFFLVGNAGSTNSGAVDELDKLADLCQLENIWYHIDGAYGGAFMLTAAAHHELKGFARADSINLDPHKGLQQPYGTGALLVARKTDLYMPRGPHCSYMPAAQPDTLDLSDMTFELSRDFRGLRLWLSFCYHGKGAFRRNIEVQQAHTRWLAGQIQRSKYLELRHEPQLTILNVRLQHSFKSVQHADMVHRKWYESILQRGEVHLTGCTLDEFFHLRVCLLGYRITHDDLEKLFAELESTAVAVLSSLEQAV